VPPESVGVSRALLRSDNGFRVVDQEDKPSHSSASKPGVQADVLHGLRLQSNDLAPLELKFSIILEGTIQDNLVAG